MSRIGKNPIAIPSGVNVNVEGQNLTVKGSKGELKATIAGEIVVSVEDGKVWVKPRGKSTRARSMWGMSRSLVNNMVQGVSQGFTERLEINGVGFRAAADKQFLTMSLGFSHEIKYAIPTGITIVAEKPTVIVISGHDKQKVGQVAATLIKLRKPEPYKGKGVKYEGQKIRMKEGKKK